MLSGVAEKLKRKVQKTAADKNTSENLQTQESKDSEQVETENKSDADNTETSFEKEIDKESEKNEESKQETEEMKAEEAEMTETQAAKVTENSSVEESSKEMKNDEGQDAVVAEKEMKKEENETETKESVEEKTNEIGASKGIENETDSLAAKDGDNDEENKDTDATKILDNEEAERKEKQDTEQEKDKIEDDKSSSEAMTVEGDISEDISNIMLDESSRTRSRKKSRRGSSSTSASSFSSSSSSSSRSRSSSSSDGKNRGNVKQFADDNKDDENISCDNNEKDAIMSDKLGKAATEKENSKKPEAADAAEAKEAEQTPEEILKSLKVVFVIGGPGSGKGTQCEKILEHFQVGHVSTGDLMRAEVQSGSELGQKLKDTMEKGELVTLDTVLELLKASLVKMGKDKKCFLVDGFPREREQGVRFENEVTECSVCLFFDVPNEVMTERLLKRGESSGRVDDNEETIKARLKTFSDNTDPILEYFESKGRLARIDATGTPDEIYSKVDQILEGAKVVRQ